MDAKFEASLTEPTDTCGGAIKLATITPPSMRPTALVSANSLFKMMKMFNFDLHNSCRTAPATHTVTPLITAVLKISLVTTIAPKVSYSSMSQSRRP